MAEAQSFDDGTEERYSVRTREQVETALRAYLNAPYPPAGLHFDRFAAGLLNSINERQGDAATAVRAVIELMAEMCKEIEESKSRIAELERRRN